MQNYFREMSEHMQNESHYHNLAAVIIECFPIPTRSLDTRAVRLKSILNRASCIDFGTICLSAHEVIYNGPGSV